MSIRLNNFITATALTSGDVFYITQGGVEKQVSASAVLTFLTNSIAANGLPVTVATASGDGSTVNFTLPYAPGSVNNVRVILNGLALTPTTDYTNPIGTSTITMSTPPALGDELVFWVGGQSAPGISVDSSMVAYTPTSGGTTTVQSQLRAITAPTGSSLVGFIQSGTGAVARTVQDKARESVSVLDFMTAAQIADVQAGTITLDVTAAINAAVASLGGVIGGKLFMPRGRYKTTSMITLPSGIILYGEGSHGGNSAQRQASTSIYAVHSGSAIISLAGANGVTLEDIGLQSDSVIYPKTGLMLGRTSLASSGYHKITRVSVYGYFSVAPFYSIASEDNLWTDIYACIYGGAAKYCFYTSASDGLSVNSLIASSNLENTLIRPWFLNTSADANSAGIYMECTQPMGSWNFIGGYITMYAGAYIHINTNTAGGGVDTIGPFTFIGTSGERYTGGDPLYGYRLTVGTACVLTGLNILGGRFDLQAGTNHYQIYKAPTLTLQTPNITLQPPEAFPYALTSVSRDRVLGGALNVGRDYTWTNVTFETSWSNTLGAPWAPASYCVDSDGFVNFRGQVVSTELGPALIFYLPSGLIPPVNMYFGTSVGTTVGQILITSATGAVTLSTGATTSAVDLSPIRFKMY